MAERLIGARADRDEPGEETRRVFSVLQLHRDGSTAFDHSLPVMVEIVKFLVKRARRERKGRINWPIGIPITLGDLGRVSRGLYVTEGVGSLQSLGIDFTEVPDTSPDSIDWQYSEDS